MTTKTENSELTIEELARTYLASDDVGNVAQIVLHEETSDSTLWFRAYGPVKASLPDAIAEADSIEIGGKQYDFYFDVDPYWPDDRGGLATLYSADWLDESEPVSLDRGVDAVRERINEAVEQGGFDSPAHRQA
jgi:hypothetical protein